MITASDDYYSKCLLQDYNSGGALSVLYRAGTNYVTSTYNYTPSSTTAEFEISIPVSAGKYPYIAAGPTSRTDHSSKYIKVKNISLV